MDRAALRDDLRATAFALGGPPRMPRIGAEVEVIPVDAATGAQVPVRADAGPATLPLLRRFGARHGWRQAPSPYGVPCFHLPDGGVVSYEPGGQIELSAAACPSAGALVHSLRATILPLRDAMRDAGIELLSMGIAPTGTVGDVPLQLPGPRYVRLTRFLDAIGTGGTRMMRQTAAMQISVDFGADPLPRWRVLNALAPWITAVFASSPVHHGVATGERSVRARIWRELDGGRTGIFPCRDPVEEYLEFALRAPSILRSGDEEEGYPPMRARLAEGAAGMEAWHAHLTTLFPEVRPKGFAEVRSADAVAPEWYAAPLVFIAGIVEHAPSLHAAHALLGEPDPALLRRAGGDLLADPRAASVASDLWDLALAGAEALSPFIGGAEVEEARAFADRYTRRARSPADDVLDALAPASPPPSEAVAAD